MKQLWNRDYLMSAETAAYTICIVALGIVKLTPKLRYRCLALGFTASAVLTILAYLSTSFHMVCLFLFLGGICNCAGNAVFNASLALALPRENRGAMQGFISAAATGGCALSSVLFGILGEFFPLHLVFIAGSMLCLIPMSYMCFHKSTRAFILEH